MTTTLFALPAGHKKEKEPASVPIADSRLRRVRLCAPAAEHRQLQREHLRQHPREHTGRCPEQHPRRHRR